MIPLSSVLYWKELLLVISLDKIVWCAMRFYEILVLIPRRWKKINPYTSKAIKTEIREIFWLALPHASLGVPVSDKLLVLLLDIVIPSIQSPLCILSCADGFKIIGIDINCVFIFQNWRSCNQDFFAVETIWNTWEPRHFGRNSLIEICLVAYAF